MQQVTIISYMETMENNISNSANCFPRLKRYIQKHLYAYPQQRRYVSLTHLKNAKMITVDVEECLRERVSLQHKVTTKDEAMEQKFNELSQKLDLVMEQITALTTSQQKQSKWSKVKKAFMEEDEDDT